MDSWLQKISLLKKLLDKTGPLWPDSTKLAGFASDGPYSCSNCTFLKGRTENQIFLDDNGNGRCNQPVMIMDPEVPHDDKGLAIIPTPHTSCCEFVHPPENEDELS